MKRLISICFDDGLKRQIDFAKSLEIPITFSIPTKNIGESDRFMTWDQVYDLSKSHEIACHSHNHNSWNSNNFNVELDIKTSLDLFKAHGITPCSFIPPRNEWIEHEIIRKNFHFGRKGDGTLLADMMRIKACGLSRMKTRDIAYAYNFNYPRKWAVYVAHLYCEENQSHEIFGDEYNVIRKLVEYHKSQGAHFVTLREIAKEFKKELDAIYVTCPFCGGNRFLEFSSRQKAKCASCGSLERHRDLAFLLDNGLINVQGKKCLLISSGELLKVLERNGAIVTTISPFKQKPYNDIHDLSYFHDYDCAFLQHVLPFVDNPDTAIKSIIKAITEKGIIYMQHPVHKNLKNHQLRSSGYGYNFSDNEFTLMIKKNNLSMERFSILPLQSDFMFVAQKI